MRWKRATTSTPRTRTTSTGRTTEIASPGWGMRTRTRRSGSGAAAGVAAGAGENDNGATMARQDTTEFLAAFAVGTVLGIGATLLLRPQPKTAKERLLRELKPYRKKMRRSAGQVARGLQRGRAAPGEMAEDAIDAGRELLSEFRDEVRRIVAEARDELRETMAERRKDERRSREHSKGERRRRGAG